MHASDASAAQRARDRSRGRSAAGESHAKFSTHELTLLALDGDDAFGQRPLHGLLTPKEYAGLNQDLDGGDFGGTGIVIQVDDQTKYISVENVVPDGPADKAGVQQDDLITAIDGKSTKGLSMPASQRQAARQGRHAASR